MSVASASKKHSVPRTTLQDKLHGRHNKRVGYPTALNATKEKIIVETLVELTKCSYQLTKFDIRLIIQGYLNKEGRTVIEFADNMPGDDFMNSFMLCNNLTQCLATNISHYRAAVFPEMVTEFFENAREKLENIQPEKFFNFDETNLTDNPAAKKVVVLRGTK